ncbi:hypothetical protein [Mycolicibacterium poriferae]|uniref:hypothetical protein n=1 Tax=Mycolicibacterium poriferae TaxID=39694 RepID=UPI0013D1D963|nr:hypothetical protein [Mycolicibacterium poriferae]MCV7263344.1 hypothetical protein [Mycolicibacterium poriferae]
MTGPDDHSSTRPISVAELLAKNGTIGAPPVGGRRRRRRGNADAVTVAELTGEIPIIRPDEPEPSPAPVDEAPAAETDTAAAADSETAPSTNGEVDTAEPEVEAVPDAEPHAQVEAEPEVEQELDVEAEPEAESESEVEPEPEAVPDSGVEPSTGEGADSGVDLEDDSEDDYADAVAEYSARLEDRDAEPAETPAPRRFGFGRLKRAPAPDVDAEQMSPDPLDDTAAEVDADTLLEGADEAEAAEVDDLDSAAAEADVDADREADVEADGADRDDTADADDSGLPSYLRSSSEPLFGGQTVADDLARRAGSSRDDDVDGDGVDVLEEDPTRARPMSSVAHGAWIVGQSVLAVVFGAGLFVAFDQLWKWNNIVALVLSVLVILGLVVGVRVVRKTEDIGSTLIAVAVGALVTLGPLALLQSG